MTFEEFCKKWCYNGHDPNSCKRLTDLRIVFGSLAKRVEIYEKALEEIRNYGSGEILSPDAIVANRALHLGNKA